MHTRKFCLSFFLYFSWQMFFIRSNKVLNQSFRSASLLFNSRSRLINYSSINVLPFENLYVCFNALINNAFGEEPFFHFIIFLKRKKTRFRFEMLLLLFYFFKCVIVIKCPIRHFAKTVFNFNININFNFKKQRAENKEKLLLNFFCSNQIRNFCK